MAPAIALDELIKTAKPHSKNASHIIALQIANGGGLEAMALDTAGRVINRSYGERVALHESGHFLIAYLLGWLPRAYTLSSLDAFRT